MSLKPPEFKKESEILYRLLIELMHGTVLNILRETSSSEGINVQAWCFVRKRGASWTPGLSVRKRGASWTAAATVFSVRRRFFMILTAPAMLVTSAILFTSAILVILATLLIVYTTPRRL